MSARDTTPAETVEHLAEQAVQIRHLTADFRARELPLHESNTGSFYRFKKALESLEHRHGNMGIRGQAPFDLQSIFLRKTWAAPFPASLQFLSRSLSNFGCRRPKCSFDFLTPRAPFLTFFTILSECSNRSGWRVPTDRRRKLLADQTARQRVAMSATQPATPRRFHDSAH